MLDSLLTLTKAGVFWLTMFFIVCALLHIAIVAITGVQEPIFLLGAITAPVALVVSGVYTLAKKLFHR